MNEQAPSKEQVYLEWRHHYPDAPQPWALVLVTPDREWAVMNSPGRLEIRGAAPNPFEDRARAWDAIARKLEEINPHTFEARKTGLQCALDEIERLQDRSIVASEFAARCVAAVGRDPNAESVNLFELADQVVGCIEQYKHEAERTAHEPRAELPKPINHDLWRHLHDEHGLTLLQSELDEILRLAQPPASEPPAASQLPDLRQLLCGLAQMLDTVKSQDWATCWSEWDQQQRDGITAWCEHLDRAAPPPVPARCHCGAHEWPDNAVQIEDSRNRLHTPRGCQPSPTKEVK